MLETCDKEEDKQELKKKLIERKDKQEKYRSVQKELEESGEDQISLTDPDSRAVVLLRNIVNVGYNIQSSSDSKHKLLVEYDTGDVNDTNALAPIAIQTKELLEVEHMNVLCDKGYHTGAQMKQCDENNITTFVSPRRPCTKDIGLYPITMFKYDKEKDSYTCPQGNIMRTNGRWYKRSESRRRKSNLYHFQRYTTAKCKTCKSVVLCTKNKINYRVIDRSEYADIIESNAKRVNENPDYYRQRQQVTEHMFGTLKRQRGFTHVLTRGKEKVMGEVGLMFIGYNLTRCISILGVREFIKALKECCFHVFKPKIGPILRSNNDFYFTRLKMAI